MNSLWEGGGNVHCLDMMRALSRTPEVMDTFLALLDECRGTHRGFDAAVAELRSAVREGAGDAFTARLRAERMAVLLQARLLLEHVPEHVADAFIRSRLNPDALADGGLRDPAAADWLLGRLNPA